MTFRRCAAPPRGRQQGVALLLAMLIVTLVSTLAAGMVWQQWQAFEVESAVRLRQQGRWLLAGATDWALQLLKNDARTSGDTDTLTEIWAQGLEETSLSSFLAADRDNNAALSEETAPEAFLSGNIRDAQARYNLRNLLASSGEQRQAQQAILDRLCDSAGLPNGTGTRVAQSLQAAQAGEQSWGESGDASATEDATVPLRPRRWAQMSWLGLEPAALEKLGALVTLLPRPTPLNINTASAEVLAAVVPGMDRASAQRLVQQRLSLRKGFERVEDAREFWPAKYKPDGDLGVSTLYFEVMAQLRYEGLVWRELTLVRREGGELRVLWRESLPAAP